MNFTFDELKLARDRDYSDDEIWGKLIEQDDSLSVAKERGYSLEEVASKLSNKPIPQEPEPEPSGVLRQAADIPIKVAEGAIGSVKSFADLFGADNAVSKNLAGYEKWVGGLVSAESKQDSKEIARILKDAEDKGVYDKVIAGLNAFAKAPLEMSAQSVGYMVPQLAAGVLGKAAQFTKAGIIGTQAAIGFAQGIGMIKGDIYTATTDYLREKGVPEDKIEAIATKAQSYGGGNLDQMLIGGGLLAVDAITGADAILTRVLTKQGKPVSDGIIKGIIKGGLKEGAIEVPQEGQQQVATNVALQREGYDVPTYEGAVQRAAVGGFAGFAMGSVLGGFEAMSPERKAEIKIDKAAEQAARDLETPSDDPAAMALSTEITRNQDAIENLRLDLDAMEPNDPRAQKLRFDISDRQKALTDLQLQYQKITGNDQEIPAVSIAASRRMEIDNKIETLTEEIGMDEEALTLLAEGSQERIDAQAALDKKKVDLATATKEAEGLSLTITPPVAEAATPSATIEEAKTKVEQLNAEFDALDENDQAGIDRVNKQIFAEQNKIAELTAIEQGVEPQGTTPTREMGLPPSGRRSPFGTLYRTDETGKAERPILQAFMSATDKVIAALPAFNKGTLKLKNAIRTGIANNAGFLAGTNTKVITSEDYGKLTGRKQTAANTYIATFLNGQKYLVVPDINQLAGISIKGEQRAASKDAALDQESRAAAKKLEEEVIHLSMFQGIQDEYKALKNPKLSEQEYVIKRLSDIVKEVKRTNPNALPGVSNAYLNDNSKLLDDLTFSQEFMRMVIQRVRTGQITEDLNAIRQAEQEAFSDKDKGAIISLKNSILNALRVVRDSITRYLGKGTSTKEVEKMKNAINAILDEYGIVKGEANYEFQDYSTAQPKGELKAEPIEEAIASVETPATPAARPLPTDQLPTETPGARYGREAEVFDVFSEAKRKPVELIPNSEVTEEVEAINSLPDNATYEEIQRVAPATIINLKAASQYVSGSFSEFQKIILNSFKSLKRFAETIWKGIRIPLIAITSSTVAMGPFIASDYFALSGPEGRADLRETGLILKPTNIFKPYIKNISVEQLDKSLQTPEETLKLIRDAIKQSKPFSGKIDFDFSSLSKFFEGLDVNNIPAGNKKITYNYNNLIETSNDEIKSAAEFLKSASSRTQEIESRLREIMGAMEFFTKRNFNDIRFKIKDQHLGQPETRRNGNALESAVFVALARNGGMISSLSFYNNKTNTINLDPQTLISILDNTNAATNAAQHIANELTHALQYQTNKGKPIGLLSIKLSDYDTASTALWMRIDMYSQYGKEFQLINAESNWGDILVKKYFNAKHKIQPKSFAQITNDQPRIKQALESKQTEAFINEIFSYGGISAEEIIEAKAGVTPSVSETITPAIEAKAGVTPKIDTEYLAAVESGDMETAQQMVDKAAKSAGYNVGPVYHGTTAEKFNIFDKGKAMTGLITGHPIAKYGFFFSPTEKGTEMYSGDSGRIIKAYLKASTPFEYEMFGKLSLTDERGIAVDSKVKPFIDKVKKLHDSIRLTIGGKTIEWMVFESNQIKSADPVTYDEAGKVIPLSQRFDVTSPIIARAGVTPNAQYSEAIKGDNGNDTITPKTNQETWANNNPESASKINSLILQRVREVGHLWKGSVKMPMFKAASKDFDSAGGDVGSFFAETKEHAMSYLEKGGKIFSAYIKMDNPANSSDVVRVLSKAFPQYAEQFRSDQGDWGSVMSTGGINDGAKFVEAMQDAGYDGVYQWDGADAVAVVFNPNQAKSADLATFDTKGQVIPISERFSPESPLIARAGVTPQPSARSVKIEKKITQQIISDIEGLIDDLKPKKNKSGQPYVSRTTLKGETYAKSLVSPFSKAVNLYTMTGHESALSAFNKVLKGNPDASFFDIASNLTLRDENGEPVVTYGLSKEELPNLIHLLNIVAPTYRQMVMDSDASFEERSRIALSMPAIEFGLTKAVVKIMQAAGRTLNLAKTLRQIGGYGMAIANYKSNVQKSIGNLWSKIGGDMNDIASYARGDRRKAVDNVASLSKVISKLVSLQKMAIKNPEKARDSIRKAISGKQTQDTKKILLAFSASTFDDKTEKFANMIIDETAKAILSIGTKKGSSNTDSTYKKIYKAISSVAKQTAQEEEKKKQEAEGQPKAKKQVAKREGKFLEQVGMVIGNDKTYKQFMDEVRKSIRQEYQSDADFNADYKDLFDKLSNREWSESMRQQAIKDSADALDYKFAELFQYIGSQRNAAQESVKTHMRFELQSMGATAEMVDKFTADVDSYLNEETRKVLEKKLGFVVDKETGKITGGQIIKDKMKELSTTDGQFKLAKTLKGLTRLAASDQRNFIDKLNELIITELGFDDTASSELSKIIEGEITKAVTAQQSQNLKQAIDRVTKTLEDNNIKAKGTQRTILKRLIELANMGQLDDMKVYEAFRQTHNFGKGYLEYSPDMVQTLREWGDRISALPEGVLRGIEEQKMGRYMLEKGVFTTTDYLSSYWYFSLLSQTGTQAMNILGSSFNLMGNIATWAIYTKGKSLGPMMRGLARAVSGKQSPAANSFLYVMQTGLNPSGLQDEKMMIYPKGNVFENSTPENVPKLVYKLITFGADSVKSPALNALLNTMSPRGMMRMMRATDAYMREVAYEVRAASLGAEEFSQEQYDAAFRQAEAELQGSKSATREKKKEIIIRANEILANQRLGAKKREFAEQDSLEVMYSQKSEGLVGLIASFANKMLDAYPVTRLFIPFTNVCANVLNENLNYAPLVSQFRLMRAVELSPLLKGKIKLRPGTEKNPFIKGREEKAADLAIKSVIGLGASAVPFIIAAIAGGDEEDQGKERPFVQFYSQGPKDPEQNKIWSENGGTKYSIRFGNTYVSYLFTPLVIPLSWGQMMKEEADAFEKKTGEKGIGDVSEAVFKLLASPVSIGFVAALDQSFLTGISDLIELKEARDLPKAGAGIARNIISRMLVPGVARDIQKLMVDERLEGDLYITNMLKEFPGSSAFLDKDLNYFGDKARYNSIMQEDGFTRRAFSLIGRIASTEKPDPAFEILYKNGVTPPNWSQSMKWMDKTPMTKAEQREFIAAAGPQMKQFIIDNESTISMLDTEDAQKFIANSFSAIKKGAKGMMEINRTK